jgi:hypothetical protein
MVIREDLQENQNNIGIKLSLKKISALSTLLTPDILFSPHFYSFLKIKSVKISPVPLQELHLNVPIPLQ